MFQTTNQQLSNITGVHPPFTGFQKLLDSTTVPVPVIQHDPPERQSSWQFPKWEIPSRHHFFGFKTTVSHGHPWTSMTGWWFQPSEKHESQLGLFFPIYGKIKAKCSKQPTRFIDQHRPTI